MSHIAPISGAHTIAHRSCAGRAVEPVCRAGCEEGPTNPFTLRAPAYWKFLEREKVSDRFQRMPVHPHLGKVLDVTG